MMEGIDENTRDAGPANTLYLRLRERAEIFWINLEFGTEVELIAPSCCLRHFAAAVGSHCFDRRSN
jgi:hypothetical protein